MPIIRWQLAKRRAAWRGGQEILGNWTGALRVRCGPDCASPSKGWGQAAPRRGGQNGSGLFEGAGPGVPVSALAELSRQEALSPDDVHRLIIPRRTLAHRKAKAQPLNRVESERAVRVASMTALAEETFANKDKAQKWLRRPTAPLGGERPIDLLDSSPARGWSSSCFIVWATSSPPDDRLAPTRRPYTDLSGRGGELAKAGGIRAGDRSCTAPPGCARPARGPRPSGRRSTCCRRLRPDEDRRAGRARAAHHRTCRSAGRLAIPRGSRRRIGDAWLDEAATALLRAPRPSSRSNAMS